VRSRATASPAGDLDGCCRIAQPRHLARPRRRFAGGSRWAVALRRRSIILRETSRKSSTGSNNSTPQRPHHRDISSGKHAPRTAPFPNEERPSSSNTLCDIYFFAVNILTFPKTQFSDFENLNNRSIYSNNLKICFCIIKNKTSCAIICKSTAIDHDFGIV
jgi:hypothetical protein